MEIMIALTLMAVGGTMIMGKVLDKFEEGKVNAAKAQISGLKGLMEEYRRYCSQYPTTEQGLDALVAKPTVPPDCSNYPANGIADMKKTPEDPWGKPYVYESDGKTFVITSYGKDKAPGGKDFDKDIISTEL